MVTGMETTSDPVALVRATDRRVVPTQVNGLPARVVTAGRTYQAGIADVWDALTSARRLPAARSRPASRRGCSR